VADSKQEETFKVVDRRLFGEDGELRKDVVEQERREEEAAEKKAASQAQQKAQTAAPTGKASGSPATPQGGGGLHQAKGAEGHGLLSPDGSQELTGGEEVGDAAAGGEQHTTSRSFQMLVDFLTRNAAAMLGRSAHRSSVRGFGRRARSD
jgi:hypothetical protein